MTSALQRALNPRNIAVVGASERPESRSFHLWRAVAAASVAGSGVAAYPVNPKYRYVGETKAYASIADIPGGVDLAVLALPQTRIVDALQNMDARCVGAVLIAPEDDNLFVDGLTTRAVTDTAKARGLRLIGPDSIGIALPYRGVNASFWQQTPPAGGIALITQSGMIATALVERMAGTNAGFSAVINSGTEADLSMPDFIEYFARDVRTRVIALQIEAVRDPKRLFGALRAASAIKPVVVLRAGTAQSYVPERLAALRFGTDAGRREVFAALVRQAGAHLVTNFSEFAAATAAFSIGRLPQGKGDRTAILTNGSGFAAMVAVDAQNAGLTLPGLANDIVQTMRRRWPGEQMPANPIILGAGSSEARFRETLELILSDPGIDAVLTIAAPNPALDFGAVVRAVAKAAQTSIKPIVFSWESEARSPIVRRILSEIPDARICAVRAPNDAAHALGLLAQQTKFVRIRRTSPASPRPKLGPDAVSKLRELVADAFHRGCYNLEGRALDIFFQTLGFVTVLRHTASSAEEAVSAARSIGYPVVMKAAGEALGRRAELGLVDLPLVDDASVQKAWIKIQKAFNAADLMLPWMGVEIEAMYPHFAERELTIRLERDHVFGPYIEFGQGGLFGELHTDRATVLPPVGLDEARRVVRRPAIAKTFGGFRGMPPVDTDRAAALLCLLSDAAIAIPALHTVRLDPIVPEADGFRILGGAVELWDAPVVPDAAHSHLTIGVAPEVEPSPYFTRDGTLYHMRPLEEDDFPQLSKFFNELSDKSFFLRFHSSARLPCERIAALCRLDLRRAAAWVEVTDSEDGGKRIAAHGCVMLTEGGSAEFGIVVEDQSQRRGLATRMLEKLEKEARRLGAQNIVGIVLRGNDGMNALLEKRGYAHVDGAPNTYLWRKYL